LIGEDRVALLGAVARGDLTNQIEDGRDLVALVAAVGPAAVRLEQAEGESGMLEIEGHAAGGEHPRQRGGAAAVQAQHQVEIAPRRFAGRGQEVLADQRVDQGPKAAIVDLPALFQLQQRRTRRRGGGEGSEERQRIIGQFVLPRGGSGRHERAGGGDPQGEGSGGDVKRIPLHGCMTDWRPQRDSYSFNPRRLCKLQKTLYAKNAPTAEKAPRRYKSGTWASSAGRPEGDSYPRRWSLVGSAKCLDIRHSDIYYVFRDRHGSDEAAVPQLHFDFGIDLVRVRIIGAPVDAMRSLGHGNPLADTLAGSTCGGQRELRERRVGFGFRLVRVTRTDRRRRANVGARASRGRSRRGLSVPLPIRVDRVPTGAGGEHSEHSQHTPDDGG